MISLVQEPLFADLSTVALGDTLQGLRNISKSILPGDLNELVLTPGVKEILGLEFGGQLRASRIHPGLPPLANDGMTQPVRAVQDPVEGIALGTLAWIPIVGGLVAIEIRVILVVVGGTGAGHDAVADIGTHSAGMGIVG